MRVLMAILYIAAFAFVGCATTTMTETRFEKETTYYATFPCMSKSDVEQEVNAAIQEDCTKYGKKALFGKATSSVCEDGRSGEVIRIIYKCVDREAEVD